MMFFPATAERCFNTQPPEGGWVEAERRPVDVSSFNTQPPEGGWAGDVTVSATVNEFQHTAARRRLA